MGAAANTYSTERPKFTHAPQAAAPILSPSDIIDIQFFFNEFEAAAFGASGPTVTSDGCLVYDDGQVELVSRHVTERANRVRRTLMTMQSRGQSPLLVVLFRLHGPRGPGDAYAEFRDLAPIVELTDAAEEARVDLARRDGIARAVLTQESVDDTGPAHEDDVCETFWDAVVRAQELSPKIARLAAKPTGRALAIAAEADFWKGAAQVVRLDAKIAGASPEAAIAMTLRREARMQAIGRRLADFLDADTVSPKFAELRARRDAWVEVQRRCIEGHLDGAAAVRSSQASALRERTTADAVKWRLDYHGKRDGEGRPEKDAHTAWVSARALFVSKLRREADGLRVTAARAYADARNA